MTSPGASNGERFSSYRRLVSTVASAGKIKACAGRWQLYLRWPSAKAAKLGRRHQLRRAQRHQSQCAKGYKANAILANQP
jgi:hypothetical protein